MMKFSFLKKISEINYDYLINSFKLNSIGHALIIKHFTPLFSEENLNHFLYAYLQE